jgi:hypothetical protein
VPDGGSGACRVTVREMQWGRKGKTSRGFGEKIRQVVGPAVLAAYVFSGHDEGHVSP